MPTSMLDALAHEQTEIAKLLSESSRLAIEGLRRSNLLRKQLEFMASEERCTADSAISGILGIAATPVPAIPAQPQIQNSPDTPPQARDSEEGNQGSGVVASGGARAQGTAEPEQAVAVAASDEQVRACNDSEAEPDEQDEPYFPLDHVLDLYAENGDRDVAAIAKIAAVSEVMVATYIRCAREDGDKRAAAGDALRLGADPVEKKPRRKFPQPLPVAAEEAPVRERPPGDLLILDLKAPQATYDDQTITLARWELRLLLMLNNGVPATLEACLQKASFVTGKTFKSNLARLNPRLKEIGVHVVELVGNHFQLLPLEVV